MGTTRQKGSGHPLAIIQSTESVGDFSIWLWLGGLIVIGLSLLSLAFGPAALTESDAPKQRVYPFQLRQLTPAPPPKLTANSAVIMDFDSGRVVYEKNAHQRVAPASTTKMMTAIVAVEQNRMQEKVTIEWKHLVGWASMGLWPGDVLTIEDLMWGLLLPSANEAAEAIADYLGGGSAENFVKMMNDKAAELGLQDTQFKNAHGLDEEGHYSSAYDLAVIAREALRYPLVNKMAATTEQTVYASRLFKLYNSNTLLRMQDVAPGVDGFKTGYTGDAGYCLVASVTRHGHRLITVIMGADSRNPDTIALIDYAFNSFVWESLPAPAAQTVGDENGTVRPLAIPVKRDVLISPWEKWWLRLSVDFATRPDALESSTATGSVVYSIAGQKVAQYPLKVKD